MELSKANKRRLIIGASGVALVGVVVGAFFLATKAAEVGYRPPASDVTEQEEVNPEEGSFVIDDNYKPQTVDSSGSDEFDIGTPANIPELPEVYKEDILKQAERLNEIMGVTGDVSFDDCSFFDKGYVMCISSDSYVAYIGTETRLLQAVSKVNESEFNPAEVSRFKDSFNDAYQAKGVGRLEGLTVLTRGGVL